MTRESVLGYIEQMRQDLVHLLREGCPALVITELLRDLDTISLSIILRP